MATADAIRAADALRIMGIPCTVSPMQTLKLEDLRNVLIRQEETIIFSLIERAQWKINQIIYAPGAFPLPDFSGSFSDYLLYETEKVHARVRRYTAPDEEPFFSDLPLPILDALDFPRQIVPNAINVNGLITELYREQILPVICQEGDDQNYGSSAVCDVACLQALSKRIHYGKFIAEAKFQADRPTYTTLIKARDSEGLLALLTNAEVEQRLLRRVEAKAATYGQEIDPARRTQSCKIEPAAIAGLYRRWVIPLTKQVEVDYLLLRLEWE